MSFGESGQRLWGHSPQQSLSCGGRRNRIPENRIAGSQPDPQTKLVGAAAPEGGEQQDGPAEDETKGPVRFSQNADGEKGDDRRGEAGKATALTRALEMGHQGTEKTWRAGTLCAGATQGVSAFSLVQRVRWRCLFLPPRLDAVQGLGLCVLLPLGSLLQHLVGIAESGAELVLHASQREAREAQEPPQGHPAARAWRSGGSGTLCAVAWNGWEGGEARAESACLSSRCRSRSARLVHRAS